MKGKNKTLLLRRILSGEVWRKTKNNGRQVCPPLLEEISIREAR